MDQNNSPLSNDLLLSLLSTSLGQRKPSYKQKCYSVLTLDETMVGTIFGGGSGLLCAGFNCNNYASETATISADGINIVINMDCDGVM